MLELVIRLDSEGQGQKGAFLLKYQGLMFKLH